MPELISEDVVALTLEAACLAARCALVGSAGGPVHLGCNSMPRMDRDGRAS